MDAYDVWDFLLVAKHAVNAWQAREYPGVKQEEEEDE